MYPFTFTINTKYIYFFEKSTQNISCCNLAEVQLLKYVKSDQVGVGLKIRAALEERLKQEGILKPVDGYCFCLVSLMFASFRN